MAEEEKANLRLEIAHVLFMDIVGYSKLLIDEQREALHELNNLVRKTEAVQAAEAGAGQLIRLPTGDGMALVFTSSVEAPVECAFQMSQALRAQPSLPLRIGIHSGPVQHFEDVNGRENIAGTGINIAQRVMDCGDAGHILVSKRVADDLAGSRRWAPYLHELGECEVKHGLVVSMVNLYADVVGNPARPAKFGGGEAKRRLVEPVGGRRFGGRGWLLGAGALFVVAAAVAFVLGQRGGVGRGVASAVQPRAASPAEPAPVPEKSIAVLPFDNFSEDKDSAFFAEGVQDEVLTDLAQVADLKVISRSSVMQYKDAKQRDLREIGRVLGVSHMVEGSVQRAGNKIRVTAQLIDARTDAHQWAERYDRDLQDVFAIQSEIAEAIAGQLQAAISPQEHAAIREAPTHDEQAYQLYLRALAASDDGGSASITANESSERAADLLRQATARDPHFSRAFTLLTGIQAYSYFLHNRNPAQAEAAHDSALAVERLRPGSADANLAMGYYDYHVTCDYTRARQEFTEVIRQTPNAAEAWYSRGAIARRQGRWEESLTDLGRAMDLDPESDNYNVPLRELLQVGLRRYLEAEALIDRRIATHPHQPALHIDKAELLLAWKGNIRAVRAELSQLPPGFDPEGNATSTRVDCDEAQRDWAAAQRDLAACPLPDIGGFPRQLAEGFLARFRGDEPAAVAAFSAARSILGERLRGRPDAPIELGMLAYADAGLGHQEAAVAEIRRALAGFPPGDTYEGPYFKNTLAEVLVMLGERAEAIRTLEEICGQPYGPQYGSLRVSPEWDPLRGDPRFEALVARLAPNLDQRRTP